MAAPITARHTETIQEEVPEIFNEDTALSWLQQSCNHHADKGKSFFVLH